MQHKPILEKEYLPLLLKAIRLNENIGYVTTFDHKLFKTVDAGNTWFEINYSMNSVGSVYFINEFVGWYIAGPIVYHTYDGGITWQDDQYFEYTSIRSIYFLDDEQAWIAGDNGFVATCDFTVDIGETINSLSPISVFPNPGTNHLNIKTKLKNSIFELIDFRSN